MSIIHSFWYVVVTVTTVGYGDISPTTVEGKLIAAVAILNGIIVLAMPIGVVGANFGTEYYWGQEDKKRRQRLKEQLDTRAVLEEKEDAALEDEPEELLRSGPDETATELLRVDIARSRILGKAEELDLEWRDILPELMHRKLSDSLRFFVLGFIGTHGAAASPDAAPEVTGFTAKPKIQMTRLVQLDALTTQVSKALATVTSSDELSEFGLKEAHTCRKKWNEFTDSCWEYATTMCIIEKRQEPPEYFEIKASLARR